MANQDTISLLKECDAGTKMAVSSMDEVVEKVRDSKLKQILVESKKLHEKLGNEIHAFLCSYRSEEKEPAPIAKGMSWLKTNMKLTMDESDATVADLITDGCNMGIKNLQRYLNRYQAADTASKALCGRLVSAEEQLERQLRCYL